MESLPPPKSLVEKVYEVILDALCDGTFKPGERLTQEDMATRLHVSRQPVTQALSVLKAQAFLIQSGRRGLIVTEVAPSFIEAIYQLRAVVEPLAIRLGTPRMTETTIIRGRSIVEHGRKIVAAGDARATLRADMDFHSFICDLSGNPIITETMRLHLRHLLRATGQVLPAPSTSISVWQEYDRILSAMVRGDADGAAELMGRHVIEAYERTQNMRDAPAPWRTACDH